MKTLSKRPHSIQPVTVSARHRHTAPTRQQEAQTRVELREILRSNGIQGRLTVGEPDDAYEREADRVADQVMRISDTDVAQRVNLATPQPMHIQRRCAACEEEAQRQPEEDDEVLQTSTRPGHAPPVDANFEHRIRRLKEGGSPLEQSTRNFFEPRFGQDFSAVRVHQGAEAADISRSLHAKAFTLGNHVVFGDQQYQPHTNDGRLLLGHELTHVVQQGSGVKALIQRQNGPDDDTRGAESDSISSICLPISAETADAEGGFATAEFLLSRLEDVLQNWETGVIAGVQLFSTDALARRISDLSGGSLGNFLLAFAGNTVWAAAAFAPPAWPAFAVSMGGIAIGSLPAVASLTQPLPEHEPIAAVERILDDLVFQMFREFTRQLPLKIEALLHFCPYLSVNRAIWLFIRNSFGSDAVTPETDMTTRPMILQEVVRDRFSDYGASMLERYMNEVEPIGDLSAIPTGAPLSSTSTERRAAWITLPDGSRKLALVSRMSVYAPFYSNISYSFIHWISTDLEASAVAKAGSELLSLSSRSVSRVPR